MPEDDRKKNIKRILDRYEKLLGREDEGGFEQVESKEFREYKEAERVSRKNTWYEKLVHRTAFFSFTFEDMEENHRNAIRLLDWDIEPNQIGPSAIVVAALTAVASFSVLLLNLPTMFNLFALITPVAVFYYMVNYPALRARQKVIQSSNDLIKAVLYMVIYMRSSPNLEGAVGFAVRHMDGPVAQDLKVILWDLDVRKFMTIREALDDYIDRWKPYNKGFVESLSLITSATSEANPEKRNEILTEAINRLLGFTRDQMDEFAAELKIPVMVLYGIGILLPVLGIILFPLIAAFMGGGGMVFYLAFLYNILLPLLTYLIMKNLLVGRPVSFSSETGQLRDIHPGTVSVSLLGKTMRLPMYAISVPIFLLMIAWPAPHYYNAFFGPGSIPVAPGIVTLVQEMMLVLAIAWPVGIHLIYGSKEAVRKQDEIREMDEEFPEALFELSNQLSRGQPVEYAIGAVKSQAATLRIADMFELIARNIQESGMTFRQAVFDEKRGAILEYPSKLIATVMDIIDESAKKGPSVAARSVESISRYLKNIKDTQRRLEELIGDTLSSLQFLAFVLAPIIAGIAVGMGGVISLSFSLIGGTVNQTGTNTSLGADTTTSAAPSGLEGGSAGFLSLFNFQEAIAPGLLQLVVGIYLIQLAVLIGILYVRLSEGNNPVRRNLTIGKILITSTTFYVVTVLIIVAVFGAMLQGITA